MDNEDPDIINVILESIYTVTDRTRPCEGDLANLENHRELSVDLKHLIAVVVAADMYLVPELVEAAGEKISRQLSRIRFRLRSDDDYMTEELFSGLLEAFYPNRDSPAVDVYRAMFIDAIVRAKGDIVERLITEIHMKRHPRLGLTLMASMEKKMRDELQHKERTIKGLVQDLPPSKKRKWEMYA